MDWILTFTRVMFPKTVPEAWWGIAISSWCVKDIFLKGYLHLQGWQEKKWLTHSMSVLLKKFLTVARNLGIDTISADFVSITFSVMKMLQETGKPNLFLWWCTGTLTTNAKNSILHSPVEYVSQHAWYDLHHVISFVWKVSSAILTVLCSKAYNFTFTDVL